MERLLWLYSLPHDPLHPVVCFDERPCFLIGDVVAPLNPQPGQATREHYAYQKNGSCCLLACIEPLTGQRLAQLQPQRTKREYAFFLQALSRKYPGALKIHLVQDNLNIRPGGTRTKAPCTKPCRLKKPSLWPSASSSTSPPRAPVGST